MNGVLCDQSINEHLEVPPVNVSGNVKKNAALDQLHYMP